MRSLSLGLPRMHKEAGERRDFLPELVRRAAQVSREVVVEHGMGSGMGLSEASYQGPSVRVSDRQEAFRQDVVLVLRSPEVEEFENLLRPGGILVAMIHFPTRPRRIRKLKEMGVEAISLDSLADDQGRRLVENTRAVGWNGLEAAFEMLERTAPALLTPGGRPFRVTVMGAGRVGKHAVDAATKYGSPERAAAWRATGVPGVEVTVIGRGLTGEAGYMRPRLSHTDLLVDASQRSDSSRPLVPNEWLGWLPAHAVVCDLVVDPYVPTGTPPTVRSLEGIPRGDLDQWAFLPDDPAWSRTVPQGVPQQERRAVVSCYSWPGIHPEDCMALYGRQLWPLLERLLTRGGVEGLAARGDFLDRALWRASVQAWREDATFAG